MRRNVLLVMFWSIACPLVLPAQILHTAEYRIDDPAPMVFSPEEVSVAIDLHDARNLIVGSNLYSKFYSTDQGSVWHTDSISSSFGVWGDPVLLSDQYGTIYFAHLSGSPSDTSWLDRIVIQRSTDGGRTFNDGSFTGLRGFHDQDKPALACDRSDGPFRGSLYLAWTEFDRYGSLNSADSSRILFSVSTDQANSWSAPIVLSDVNGDCIDGSMTVELTSIAVDPDGNVYVCWMGPAGLVVKRSSDGGKTFGAERHVCNIIPGWDYPVSGLYRCNSSPSLLCDVSNSPSRGTLSIVFADRRSKVSDVYITRSTDKAESWSAPTPITGDVDGVEEFFPSAAIDATTGAIYCSYYVRRHVDSDSMEVFLGRSVDAGATFRSWRLSDHLFPANAQIFLGDYIGIAAHDRLVVPVWTEESADQLTSIWSSRIVDTSLQSGVVIGRDIPSQIRVRPSPANELVFLDAPDDITYVRLYDVLGTNVMTIDAAQTASAQLRIDVHALASGVYTLVVETTGTSYHKQIVVRH